MSAPPYDPDRWRARVAAGEVELDDPELRAAAESDPALAEELAQLDRIQRALDEDASEAREVLEGARAGPGAAAEERVRRAFLAQFEKARGGGTDHRPGAGAEVQGRPERRGSAASARPARSRIMAVAALAAMAAAAVLFVWLRPAGERDRNRTRTPLGGGIRAVTPEELRDVLGIERFEVAVDAAPVPGRTFVFHVFDADLEELASSEGDDEDPSDTSWTPRTPIEEGQIRWQVEVQENFTEVARSALFSSSLRSR